MLEIVIEIMFVLPLETTLTQFIKYTYYLVWGFWNLIIQTNSP